MRRALRHAVLALCALAAPASASGTADGTYAVVIQWRPYSPWQHLAFRVQGDGGTVYLNGREPKLSVTRIGDSLDLRWQSRTGAVGDFHGDIADDDGATAIAGTFTQGPLSAPFQALRLADVPPATVAARDGIYAVSKDRAILIARSSEAGDAQTYFDSGTRRTGVLYPVSRDRAGGGPTLGALLPVTARFDFPPPTVAYDAVTVRFGDEPSVLGVRSIRVRSEDLTFRNGDVTLRGTLMIPSTAGPHPAIVMIHGAGPAHRPLGLYPYGFLQLGFAVLAFDKRGAGESTGDYRTASFPDLAGDVIAGIDAIKQNPAIDPHRIGLFASSNGGWVAPVVATRSRDVAFVICRVCSMLTVAQNQAYERESIARNAGLSDADVTHVVALRNAFTRAVVDNAGWDALRAQIAEANDADWLRTTGVPPGNALPLEPTVRAATAAQLAFDPAPYWKRVNVPTLFLFAENDGYVKTSVSAPRATQYLSEAGNRDVSVAVLKHADHAFLESDSGLDLEEQRASRFAAGFTETLARWTQAHHLATAH